MNHPVETAARRRGRRYDALASARVREAAEHSDGAAAGRVPALVMAELYRHARALSGEVVRPVLGVEAPPVALSIDLEDRRQLGHYKVYRDGLGLAWRVSLNLLHLGRPKREVVATLLHEMMHAAQHDYGHPSRSTAHNAEFRGWCAKLGIPTDSAGHYKGITDGGPLDLYFGKHEVSGSWDHVGVPAGERPRPADPDSGAIRIPKPKGSKLKKWSCACPVNLRVAVDLHAKCLDCGQEFRRKS